jgi:hypothetical protein
VARVEVLAPRRAATPVAAAAAVVLTRRVVVGGASLRSVAKLAVACWTCAGVFLLAAAVLSWQALRASGVVGDVEGLIGELVDDPEFRILSAGLLAAALFGLAAFVLAGTTLTLVAAAWYNLIAGALGGIEVELCERLPPEPGSPAQHDGDGHRSDDHADATVVWKS